MPVTGDEWESGTEIQLIASDALDYLQKNHPNGYTHAEIAENMHPQMDPQEKAAITEGIDDVLNILETTGHVEMADVNGTIYTRAVMD